MNYLQAGLSINMDKPESLVVGNNIVQDLVLENNEHCMKEVEKYKNLGVIFNKKGTSEDPFLWNADIRKAKTRLHNPLLRLKVKRMKQQLLAVEIAGAEAVATAQLREYETIS